MHNRSLPFSGTNFWKILAVLVTLNLLSFCFFYWQSATNKDKNDTFSTIEQQNDFLTRTNEGLQQKLARYTEESFNLSRVVDRLKAEKDEIEKAYHRLRGEKYTDADTEIEREKGDKIRELEKEAINLMSELTALKDQSEAWEGEKERLQKHIHSLEDQLRVNEPAKPHNCTHVEEECKINEMSMCTYPLKILDQPELVDGPIREIDITCSDPHGYDRFCKYSNICIINGTDGYYHFQLYSSKQKGEILGWNAKRKEEWASQNWWLRYHPMSEVPVNMTVKWVKGTHIWIDPRYTNFWRQPGHFFETGYKLLELRKRFPGPIDGFMLARQKGNNLVDYVCQTFRLAFEKEGWELPPIYFFEHFYPNQAPNLCFENILIPKISNLYFGSKAEVDDLRSAALKLCNISERPLPEKPKTIFKMDRDGRQLVNWPQLCELPQLAKYEIRTKCFEKLSLCQQIEHMYWGDIIITPHGSGQALTAFARKGSVVIDILPPKLRNPDLKSIAYYASLRYLEFVNMNNSATGLATSPPWNINMEEKCFKMTVLEVKDGNWWSCFAWYQELYHHWYPENFLAYIREAERRHGRYNEYDLCEIIGPVRDHPYWTRLTEGNWMVCEPPSAINCNKDPDCALTPDGSQSLRTQKKPFDPNIVLRDYNKL